MTAIMAPIRAEKNQLRRLVIQGQDNILQEIEENILPADAIRELFVSLEAIYHEYVEKADSLAFHLKDYGDIEGGIRLQKEKQRLYTCMEEVDNAADAYITSKAKPDNEDTLEETQAETELKEHVSVIEQLQQRVSQLQVVVQQEKQEKTSSEGQQNKLRTDTGAFQPGTSSTPYGDVHVPQQKRLSFDPLIGEQEAEHERQGPYSRRDVDDGLIPGRGARQKGYMGGIAETPTPRQHVDARQHYTHHGGYVEPGGAPGSRLQEPHQGYPRHGGMEITDVWGALGEQPRAGSGAHHAPLYDLMEQPSLRQREYGDPYGSTQHLSYMETPSMLERIRVPEFSGDKQDFESWWTEFMGLVHSARIPVQQKMMRLRRVVKGEAAKAIKGFTDSQYSYDKALDILWETYGGSRRQISMRMDDVNSIKQVRDGNTEELEQIVRVMNILMVKLREDGHEHELGYGSLYFTLQKKVDPVLLRRYFSWVRDKGCSETVISLRLFLSEEARNAVYAQEISKGFGKTRDKKEFKSRTLHTSSDAGSSYSASGGTRPGCRMCSEQHGVWKCPKYKELSVENRWNKAREFFLCFRCLGAQHKGEGCRYTRKCGVNGCLNTHHSLLHDARGKYQSKTGGSGQGSEKRPEKAAPSNQEAKVHRHSDRNATEVKKESTDQRKKNEDKPDSTHLSCMVTRNTEFVALRTVPIILCGATKKIRVHALLDDASTKTYINRQVADELGLQEESVRLTVKVLNNMSTVIDSGLVQVGLKSIDGTFEEDVNAYITDDVTGNMQVIDWNQYKARWAHLADIPFPHVGRKQKVDILLGADCLRAHDPEEVVNGPPGAPVARRTPLGWTCVGVVPEQTEDCFTNFTFHTADSTTDARIESMLRRHWEIEEPESCEVVRPEDKHAVRIAENTLSYQDGRYCIGIPWKPNATRLPNNYQMACSRLCSTERKLEKNPELAAAYQEVFTSYLRKGYIRKLTDEREHALTGHLLAHFAVYKKDRATTKCRVVFDGSARVEGVSLNDMICQGPKLQADIVTVLTRFREHVIAVSCDISEMYLQVLLRPEDRKYHRFLWRDMKTKNKPDIYESLRWLFGINASPFAIQSVAKKNAEKHQEELPAAAEVVKKGTYMDDSLASVKTVDAGFELYKQLVALWKIAGMNPCKWVSNSEELMRKIPESVRNVCVDLDKGSLGATKTLGLVWNPKEDTFTYKVDKMCGPVPSTKRGFLSGTAMLFDPLGLVAPVTVAARMLLQRTWMTGLSWDEALPREIQDDVGDWFDQLPGLERIQVPRACRWSGEVREVQLHTFCDASIDAYGAVSYLRVEYQNGVISVHILRAKAKVAPVTSTSVPRLELMAAVVGVRLAAHAQRVLGIESALSYFWSDSVDTLYWIRGHSRKFRPFVANRVGEIQRLSSPASWQHVGTKENPADILSRGSPPGELRINELWWQGPPYLKTPQEEWPKTGPDLDAVKSHDGERDVTLTARASVIAPAKVGLLQGLRMNPGHHSNWDRMIRIGAYVLRFISASRRDDISKKYGALVPEEVQDVSNLYFRVAQQDVFTEEWNTLSRAGKIKASSRLIKLTPFIDEYEVLRVGGRLEASDCVDWEGKHPIVLPREHSVTELIVRKAHEDGGHSGTNKTLAVLTQRFWVLAAREAIRAWESKCMFCKRRNRKPFEQQMGSLPAARISRGTRPFDCSSVDYAGPFLTRQGRGRAKAKRYLCVFVCMSTRAVHLEIAYSMDTAAFLNALTRMTSRRGTPTEMVSDNGSNFVGATNELQALVEAMDKEKLQNATVCQGINWRFNPPSAPHFNGVHEAIVKSAKRALKAILADADVTDEELHTAICGAESMLNGRPLTYQTADPRDEAPLTPNDFLVGQVRAQFPPENVDTTTFDLRNRWRHVQHVLSQVWRRWQRELLPTLNPRGKWQKDRRNICKGEVVIVVSPDNPRGKWPLAIVEEVFPGPDGRIRAVDIKMGNARYRRPIVKLCPLEGVE